MHRLMKREGIVNATLTALLVALLWGCGASDEDAVDPEPFQSAIAEYLEQNNMALAVKAIKEGPTLNGQTATLTASLTHAELGGPSVTWEFRFEKNADGTWKAVGHQD